LENERRYRTVVKIPWYAPQTSTLTSTDISNSATKQSNDATSTLPKSPVDNLAAWKNHGFGNSYYPFSNYPGNIMSNQPGYMWSNFPTNPFYRSNGKSHLFRRHSSAHKFLYPRLSQISPASGAGILPPYSSQSTQSTIKRMSNHIDEPDLNERRDEKKKREMNEKVETEKKSQDVTAEKQPI